MDSARALAAKGRGIALVSRTMGVPRAQLSLRMNRSADGLDRRGNRRNDEANAEILSAILNIISDMPSYGYRRVRGILRKQRRSEEPPPVNAKRLYRIMSEHNLLLLHDKPVRRSVNIRVKSQLQKGICAGVQMASSSAVTTAKNCV